MKYKFLEPIKIGPITLKNRIIRSGVAEYLANTDGTISDRYVEYYRNIAKGGVSLITTGISVVDETAPFISTKQPFLTEEKFIPDMRRVVDAVHAEGAKFVFQPWHSGHNLINGANVPMVNDFTKQDIEIIKHKYLAAAKNCKEAGADGIEYHIAHTYLPSLFMSTYFNKRTDEYGSDTPENAMRFSIECIDMIREELCDDNFIITAKMNGSDYIEGGTTPQWAAQCAKLLEKAGVVMITVNAGGALVGYDYMSDNGKQPEGWKVYLAETVKNAVSIPVAASGDLIHPEYVSDIIEQGKCDLAALGRGTIAEPEWVNKAAEGREDEMRYCIACLYCFTAPAEDGSESGCSVNPYAKCEFIKPKLIKDGNDRKVVVIGAGPSGLEAAVTLSERGFNVTVLEQKPYIGGLIELAAIPPNKARFSYMIDFYKKQIERLGIDVRLSTTATVEAVEELRPYTIILATGSDEVVPAINGIDSEHVIGVRDILEKRMQFKDKNIIVIGAGMTGIEAAHYLKVQGNAVNVIELLPPPVRNIPDRVSFKDVKDDGVNFYFEHRLEKIEKDCILALDLANNKQVAMPADIVVLSLGIKPNKALYEELKSRFDIVYMVGDCSVLGKLPQAVRSGSNAAYGLK